MEQQTNQLIDMKKFQSHISRYRGVLRSISLSQLKHDKVLNQFYADQLNRNGLNSSQFGSNQLALNQLNLNRSESNRSESNHSELNSVYNLLQRMHASISQDIADLEILLMQSNQPTVHSFKQAHRQPDSRALDCDILSCKESEVLNMFAKGYSYNEVAVLLDCKLATIQTHTKRIYRKLHVHSRSEAVYEARQMDIIAA